MSVCGNSSAKDDKKHAHRGERNKQNLTIRLELKNGDFENFLLPHKRECSWNEVYSWGRDGNQVYWELDKKDWDRYLEATRPLTKEDKIAELEAALDGRRYSAHLWGEDYACWPPMWYKKMLRK